MHTTDITFKFSQPVSMPSVEDTVLLALLAAGGMYGQPRVRLESGYRLDAQARTVTVEAHTEVGRSVAQIASEFFARELGAGAFTISTGACPAAAHAA